MKAISVDLEKCTGCRTCEVVCSIEHTDAVWPERSGIRIMESYPRVFTALVCHQCVDPPCVPACSVNALELANGIVLVNQDLCTGCGECVDACPYEAMFLDKKSNLAVKCDLCQGNPTCIKYCPDEAISLEATASNQKGGKG